ncbi:MAG: shikimate kinase [Planctomycetaceae bacterium]
MRPFHHLYLTGYRGSGKTSVGAWLGRKLVLPVIDLDDRIEQATGKSIRQIFEAEGEAGFREQESIALKSVAVEPPSIVSLGGGAILREANRQLIAKSGYCVWLDIDANSAFERLANDARTVQRRPSLTSLPAREEIATLLQQRAPLYRLAANAKVSVAGKSIAAIGKEILVLLPK